MAGFVASEQVEELAYDFGEYGPTGMIPEPSAGQIRDFRKAIADMLEASLPEDEEVEKSNLPVPADGSTPVAEEEESLSQWKKERKALIEAIGRDRTEESEKALMAVAAVCSDNPSFDVLNALPWRFQQAFSGWLSEKLLLPKTLTTATTT
jgi:hypothetical protein